MKFRPLLLAGCLFSASVFSAPLSAQVEEDSAVEAAAGDDEAALLMSLFAGMFGAAPELTAEEQARHPAAQEVVNLLFPEGAYAELTKTMMGGMSDGLFSGLEEPAKAASVAKLTGLLEYEISDLGDEGFDTALAMLDPAFEQRSKIVMDATLSETTELMAAVEPFYRTGLANAYAVRFTSAQLAELLAFFKTPTGAFYAEQSLRIYSDPQVMAQMNNMFPAMMERIPLMALRMEEATAALPPERYFDQLDVQEKAVIAQLLNRSVEELDAAAAEAREIAAATDMSEWDELLLEDAAQDEAVSDRAD